MGIVVRVPDSGLPEWQEAILAVIGVAIAFAILYGLYELTQVPRRRRLRRRVAEVEAAAGDGAVFGAEAVREAAASLFEKVYAAWDETNRYALARLAHGNLMADWEAVLDANRRNGERYRVRVLSGPRVDYVGVVDRPGEDADYVVVRVRAKLRCHLEKGDGSRRPLPEARGSETMAVEEYWTLSRRDGGWILYSTRTAEFGEREFLGEPVLGPAGSQPTSG